MKKELSITNVETGENKAIEKASNEEISMFLGKIKGQKKKIEKLEKEIKKYIEEQRELQFTKTETGTQVAKFIDHTIREQERWSFDQETFDQKASEEEKAIVETAEEIKKKYQKATRYLTWK